MSEPARRTFMLFWELRVLIMRERRRLRQGEVVRWGLKADKCTPFGMKLTGLLHREYERCVPEGYDDSTADAAIFPMMATPRTCRVRGMG
jgi:hypothetical protein